MWFMPSAVKNAKITDEDIQMFFEYSERGLHKDKVGTWAMDKKYQNGFNALCEGKRWRGVHMRMYEGGVLDLSMPYSVILENMPRYVVDFIKKEMFKGADADIIENCYNKYCDN